MTPDRISELQNRFAPVLDPLATGYARLMRFRAGLFASGRLASWRPPAPCVAVGNISWGGTGKTPVVSWLLRWAIDQGLTPAVLTRGYGGHPPRAPYEVELSSPAREAGDEPLMLKRAHPRARIMVDPNRVRGGRACTGDAPGLYILDDGFQHLRVRRDVNLCLLCPRDLDVGWNKVIPAGTWREDATALKRADAFLVNRMFGEDDCLETLARIKLTGLGKPIFFFQVVARHIANSVSGEIRDSLQGERYLLVTGIANPRKAPQTFKRDLGEMPVHHLIFSDHHPFSLTDWRTITARAERARCAYILCTPKDAVKLAPFADERLWVPSLSTTFTTAGNESFPAWLEERVHISNRSIHGHEAI